MAQHYVLKSRPDFCQVELDEADSTNNYIKLHSADFPQRLTLVTAEYQTAGRGATGGWSSQEGKNLIFSLLVRPTMVRADSMFVLSEAICLAVCRALNFLVGGFCIKWPNDIYYDGQKVAGILIENKVQGKYLSECVIGVGLNVNQREFPSDIPNPISLLSISGENLSRSKVMEEIISCFCQYYERIEQGKGDELHGEYLSLMYRQKGEFDYRDAKGVFQATLETVEPTGHIVLRDHEGKLRRYGFKEVEFVLKGRHT